MIQPLPPLAGALLVAPALSLAAPTALTIYTGGFAVVRETVPLNLSSGVTEAAFSGVTTGLEPDSVVLRDPTGAVPFQVLEQSYRAEAINQGLLLLLNEGKELDFRVLRDDTETIVRGTVIRSGYLGAGGAETPVIRVDGKIRFSLPGEPLFPDLGTDAILHPTLSWRIRSPRAAQLEAELSYVTGGLGWNAAYNLVGAEKGDQVDAVGWVTVTNNSGKRFDESAVKLIAGDVQKVAPQPAAARGLMMAMSEADGAVEARAFDEFHLYTLPRPLTLRGNETKQVEFLRGTGVEATTVYVYSGFGRHPRQRHWDNEGLQTAREYGAQSNSKVWVYREIANTEANGLGVALPAGRVRFYRRDRDGRLEFTGENEIDHTPRGETVRLHTGESFDLVGERRQTDYRLNERDSWLEEAFEIKLRNRKKEAVEIRVPERLYRWVNATVVAQSEPFTRTDARGIEFRVKVEPDEEKVVTYRVRYDWR